MSATVTRNTRVNGNNMNVITRDTDVTGDGERIPFLPWDEFVRGFEWRQGEHLAAIATTQSGKTTLIRQLLPRRHYVVFLATKNKDPVIDAFSRDGFVTQREWEPVPTAWPKVILRPGLKNSDDKPRQRGVFKDCLDDAFASGGWTVYGDELRYLTKDLRLEPELQLLWLQGSSAKITVVGATQRPFHVPLEMYSMSTHLFFWHESDKRNLDRMSELDGANTDLIRWQVQRLRDFETLYVRTRKRAQGLQMARTIAPKAR